jgi:anti-sigma B factor antagonist
MEFKETKQGDIMIINVSGRLDSNTSNTLQDRVLQIIDSGERNIVLDFSSLDYISSAGLRVVLLASKKLKVAQGRIALCSMKDYIKEAFDISRLTTLIPSHASLDDALKSF